MPIISNCSAGKCVNASWENGYKCPGCFKFFHTSCIPNLAAWVNEQENETITGVSKCKNLFFFCDPCKDLLLNNDYESEETGIPANGIWHFNKLQQLKDGHDEMHEDISELKYTLQVTIPMIEEVLEERAAPANQNPPAILPDLHQMVKDAVSQAVSSATQSNEESGKRIRSITIDGLSEDSSAPDSLIVDSLLKFLGGGKTVGSALEVSRMGQVRPGASRPRKVKVLLGSPAEQATLLSKPIRQKLRSSPAGQQKWANVYISPLRTSADNDRLFLLRRRRDLLNAGLSRENSWYVDSNRLRLLKLSKGTIDRTTSDTGFDDWVRAFRAAH